MHDDMEPVVFGMRNLRHQRNHQPHATLYRCDRCPKFSPDGRWLFYSSSRGVFTGEPAAKRRTTEELLRALRGPGNGMDDVYQGALGVRGKP